MLGIQYLVGDATEPVELTGPRVIAHVCNDLGGWGAGFVLALSAKWSIPEEQYRRAFRVGESSLDLGDLQIYGVDAKENILVCNMVAQHGYRVSHSNPVPLDYNALATCLSKLRQEIKAVLPGASVHMPRIGCGLAGGTWDKVEAIIIEMLSAYDIPVFVYDLP